MISKCGMDCVDCPSYQKECMGCDETKGQVSWTQYIGKSICPVYACCLDKKHENCRKCSSLPCKMWYELKDPSISEEEHINSIDQRTQILKRYISDKK